MLASASAKKMKGDIPVLKAVNLTSFLLLHVDNSCVHIIAIFEIYTRIHTYPYLMLCTDKPLGECLFLTGSPYMVTMVTGTSICF